MQQSNPNRSEMIFQFRNDSITLFDTTTNSQFPIPNSQFPNQ
ncbi:hypothetical protein QUB13_05890 [Microcoleus sp. B4-D4]